MSPSLVLHGHSRRQRAVAATLAALFVAVTSIDDVAPQLFATPTGHVEVVPGIGLGAALALALLLRWRWARPVTVGLLAADTLAYLLIGDAGIDGAEPERWHALAAAAASLATLLLFVRSRDLKAYLGEGETGPWD